MIALTIIIFTFCLSLVSPFVPRNSEYNAPISINVFDEEINYPNRNEIETPTKPSDKLFKCSTSPSLKKEIGGYQPIVDKIVEAVTRGKFKGIVYNELGTFVDKFGSRIAGSKNLEHSLDYMINLLNQFKLENVHGEEVVVPNWVRGNESAVMIAPRFYKMKILGLGGSIATPPEGITAEVLVVHSFDELHEKAQLAKGKIVVFNQKWVSYPVSVKYRSRGAVEASKVGAVAALIRSVTPMSLYSPHTGQQDYEENVEKIPVASITVEDAQMFHRITSRGEKVIVQLYMGSETKPDKISRNIVAEVTGKSLEEEIVLLSGHLDSWDVGQGALDDGAGAFVSWFSLFVLKTLDLRPRRTVRAVLWTAEEEGLIGAKQYVQAHSHELDKFNLVMESDEGTFTPEGIEFAGANSAACILKEIAQLMHPLNATSFKVEDYVGSDIAEFTKVGVPAADLINKNDKYFWYHHTNADTMTLLNSDDLDKNVAMFAAVSYIAADLSRNLPRVSHRRMNKKSYEKTRFSPKIVKIRKSSYHESSEEEIIGSENDIMHMLNKE